jgi:hypothetical protein
MQHPTCLRSISTVFTALRLTSVTVVTIVIASLATIGQATSMDQTILSEEVLTTSGQELPLDALVSRWFVRSSLL